MSSGHFRPTQYLVSTEVAICSAGTYDGTEVANQADLISSDVNVEDQNSAAGPNTEHIAVSEKVADIANPSGSQFNVTRTSMCCPSAFSGYKN